ncbi:hypothetical protein Y1Q_0004488 [Alligator mississippiensis]|uniref:Uncharacterized protein n=1 Tax=Alligator mississippiensis TaxID=8496 RepID=A0A151NY41_ALLMI|nr:hypothetical protein Y1Q_0004488 [Alligator mississippiensis]
MEASVSSDSAANPTCCYEFWLQNAASLACDDSFPSTQVCDIFRDKPIQNLVGTSEHGWDWIELKQNGRKMCAAAPPRAGWIDVHVLAP